MASKESTYKTVFAAHIRAIQPTDEDVKEVKASLNDLKQLLPAGINPEQDYDLLYVAGDLTVAGMVNLNDDGVDIETSLATYKQFERRFLDVEHDRKRLCGYILHAGLTEFGTNKPLTEDEVRAANKPFNISIVAVLWKAVNPAMCDYIEAASAPTHTDYKALSLSFEVGFENYSIVAMRDGERNISKAELIVAPDDKAFDRFNSCLRAKKGQGVSPDDSNLKIYRVLKEGVLPLGGGVVSVPAAAVKGLTAITEANTKPVEKEDEDETPEHEDAETTDEEKKEEEAMKAARELAEQTEKDIQSIRTQLDLLAASLDIKSIAEIILAKSSVSPSTTKTSTAFNMKNQALKALTDKFAAASKLEDVKEILASNAIADIIAAESVRLETEKNAAQALAADLQKAKDAAEASSAQTAKDLEAVKADAAALRAELDSMKAAQQAAAAAQKFQERMTALDDVFELDDETRAFFLDEVKACENDESFAKFMDKSKKFHKEKTKDFKKKKAEDDKKKDEDAKAALVAMQTTLASKGIKASINDAGTLNVDEILAAAAAAPVNADMTNIIEKQKNLADLAKAAFAGAFTIGGKSMTEISEKK